MAGTSPIQLGSAVSGWTFEAASSVEESASGIQTCTVSALWPDGSTVLSNLPAAGASVSTIDSTGYVPSSFLLDYSEAGPNVDYIEGRVARVKFKFKRQDPNRIGRTFAIIESDSVINYQSPLNENTLRLISFTGNSQSSAIDNGSSTFGIFGFPEPDVSVKYNSTTSPGIGTGGLTQLYGLPGTAATQGFPAAPSIFLNVSIPVRVGGSVTYYNPTTSAFVTVGPVHADTTFSFVDEYRPYFLGWRLEKLKTIPISGGAFYDVEEQWRLTYMAYGSTFIGSVPPVHP